MPKAQELAAIVGEKREPGVSMGDTYPLRLLLCLTMDRDWPVIPADQPIPQGTRWIIASKKNAPVEGFAEVHQDDGVVLLQRK